MFIQAQPKMPARAESASIILQTTCWRNMTKLIATINNLQRFNGTNNITQYNACQQPYLSEFRHFYLEQFQRIPIGPSLLIILTI